MRTTVATFFLSFISLLIVFPSFAQKAEDEARDEKYISAVKKISAQKIDPALPDIPFEDWLVKMLGANSKYSWEVNDCGEQPGFPEPGRIYPTCVEVDVKLPDGKLVTIMLAVDPDDLSKAPVVWFGNLQKDVEFRKLSDLELILR